jgi:hypothetical protein
MMERCKHDVLDANECYICTPENEEYCEHFEHDHGICLDCGEDITDQLISRIDFKD